MLQSATYEAPTDSPIGTLMLIASEAGLRAVLWPNDLDGSRDYDRVPSASDPSQSSVAVVDSSGRASETLEETARQLDGYFSGERKEFSVPLDPVGTEFQVEVWQALATVPYGETTTYGKQSANLGKPRAIRAVASANGRNPLSIVLPCHRIIGADGSLTGFAAGLEAKRWLLDHEANHAGFPRLPGL